MMGALFAACLCCLAGLPLTASAAIPADHAAPTAAPTAASAAVSYDTVSVQLDWYPNIDFVSLYQAEDQKLFAKSRLDVKLLPWKVGVDVVKEVSEGRADIGLAEALPVLTAIDRGEDLIALYAFLQETPLCLVSVKAPLERIEDLRGKKVATLKGFEYLVDYLRLRYPQLKDQVDYQLLDDNLGAVERGAADVGIFFETAQLPLLRLRGYPVHALRYRDLGFDVYSHVIFVRKEYYKAHRESLRRLLKTLQYATRRTFADPKSAVKFFTTAVPYDAFTEGPFKNNADYTRYQETCLTILHYYMSKGVGENYGLMNRYRWREMIQTLSAMQMIKHPMDENSVFTNDLLKISHGSDQDR